MHLMRIVEQATKALHHQERLQSHWLRIVEQAMKVLYNQEDLQSPCVEVLGLAKPVVPVWQESQARAWLWQPALPEQ
jgi:hypothetical protein